MDGPTWRKLLSTLILLSVGGFAAAQEPWADQSGGDLAKEAGINDIGSSGRQASYDDNSSRSGLFGSDDDHDDMDMDSDDYGDDGGGDSE